jgi:uncharacterized repeat protein (TIGR02543 family)
LTHKSFGNVRWVIALMAALALVFTGLTPAQATHLRGAVGYVAYNASAHTVTINSTMVERKDACLNGSLQYTNNLDSSLASPNNVLPTSSLCTFFAFPTISSIDPTTGTTASVTKCAGQVTTPSSWSMDVKSAPLYNIFNTQYVINTNCPSFNPNLDYVFSQTGSNRIGGIKNTTNQVIQFEARVKLDVSHTTPIYNTGYMTNVPFAAVGDNTIFKTNLNGIDEVGHAVSYTLITNSAAANGGYGASRIPCSYLNTSTGEFQLGRSLCVGGESYDTSFGGGSPTLPIYWALKTKATDSNNQYVTRDVLLSFATDASNSAPTITASYGGNNNATNLNVALSSNASSPALITFAGRDSNSGQTLTFSSNSLPSWITLTPSLTNYSNTNASATVSIDASSVASDARVIQVSVTDNASPFPLSATMNITLTVGTTAVLPPVAPSISAVTQPTTNTPSVQVAFAQGTGGGTATSYSITATPTSGAVVTGTAAQGATSATMAATAGVFYTVVVTAINSAGSAASQPYPLSASLSVSTTTLTFTSGSSYTPTMTYTPARVSGSGNYTATGLPSGLSISTSTGVISSSTSAVTPGTYSVTVNSPMGGSVIITVIVLAKLSQTISYTNAGSIPYRTVVPGSWDSDMVPLNAYASSGLQVYFAFSSQSSSSSWVTGTTSTITSGNMSTGSSGNYSGNNGNGTINKCYLVPYNGAVYVAAAETGTTTSGTCKVYVKQVGNNTYAATSSSAYLTVYVTKSATNALAPKYMLTGSVAIPTVSVFVNDLINHPFNLCPTTGTACSSPIAYNNASASSNQYSFSSCSVANSAGATLPAGVSVSAATGCELAGIPTVAMASTLFSISITNSAGTQDGSASSPKLQFYLEVKKRTQKVTSFAQPGDLQLSATTSRSLVATSDSGNAVSFSSNNSSCVISGSTVSLASGATTGSCAITASLASTAAYFASATADNITRTFAIRAANVAPVLTLNGAQSAVVDALSTNTDIFPITASVSVPTSWEFDDANGAATLPPDGLTFDTTTGKLLGMPESSQAYVSYKIRAKTGSTGLWSNSISVRLQIAILSQSITFDALHGQVIGAADQGLSAVSTSGLLVSFASSNTAICTVVNGRVHAVAKGTCVITATQAGNGVSYAAATPVTQSFAIDTALLPPSITLTHNSATVYAGEYLGSLYDILNSGGDLGIDGTNSPFSLWDSTGTSAATLPAGITFSAAWGVFQGKPTGASAATTYTIKACNTTMPCSTATFTLTVGNKHQIITISAPSSLKVPATGSVSATSNDPAATVTLTVDSASTTICSLSGSTVTSIANGICRINASSSGDAIFDAGSGYVEITILKAPSLSISGSTLNLWDGISNAGSTYTLSYSGTADLRTTYTLWDSNSTDVSSSDIQGLRFDPTTGALSGIVNWDLTSSRNLTYTITATNQYGTSNAVTFTLNIYYIDFSTGGTYATDGAVPSKPITTATGTAMTASGSVTTGAPSSGVTYGLASDSDPLPAGLSLSASNGSISGTPTAIENANIKIVSTITASGLVSAPVSVVLVNTGVVTYNRNAPSGATGTPSTTQPDATAYTLGQPVTTRPAITGYTNYTFVSWNTRADGTGTAYAAGAILNMTASAVTLYAIWRSNSQVTVTFSSNPPSVTGATATYKTMVMTSGTATALTSNSVLVFGYLGYSFGGWATSSSSSTVAYTNGQSATLTTSTPLFAIWNAVPISGVTLNSVSPGKITNKAADLAGTITTNSSTELSGADVTSVKLCVSSSNAVGSDGKLTGSPVCSATSLWDGAAQGKSATKSVGETAGGLTANTNYYEQLQVTYSNGTSAASSPLQFTTNRAPAAATLAPNSLSRSRANIRGTINSYGSKITDAYFCWTTVQTDLDSCPNKVMLDPATWWTAPDASDHVVSVSLSELKPGVRYFYKIVTDIDDRDALKTIAVSSIRFKRAAVSAGGTSAAGSAGSFVTPSAETTSATSITGSTATINGTVYGGSYGLVASDVTSVKLCYGFDGTADALTGALSNVHTLCSVNLWASNSTVAADIVDGSGNVTTTGQQALYTGVTGLSSSARYATQIQVQFANGDFAYGSVVYFDTASTIRYHANPPSYAIGAVDSLVSQSASGSTSLRANTFAFTGLRFAHWNTSADDTGQPYSDALASVSVTMDLDLYAQWAPISYNLSYSTGGGIWSIVPSSASKAFGSAITLPLASTISRTGYQLIGWLSSVANSVTFGAGSSVSMPSQDVVYTAIWLGSTYTLTYNLSNATGNTPSPVQYVVGDPGIPLSSHSGVTAPQGTVFGGWSTTSGGTSAVSTPYVLSGDTTLYAIWSPLAAKTVTYHSNYPGGASGPANTTQRSSVTAALTGSFTAPFGYHLAGWVTSPSNSSADYALNANYNFTADLGLYALWVKDTYTVTYALGAGSSWVSGTAPTQADKSYNDVFTAADSTVALASGFHITGWSDGSTTVSPLGNYTMPARNVVLTAVWAPNSYLVTYVLGSGASWLNIPASTVDYGSVFKLPDVADVTKTGYTFSGWKLNNSGSVIAGSTSVTMPTADLSYTAVWSANTFVVTFDNGIGTGSISPTHLDYVVDQSPAYVDLGSLNTSGLSYTDMSGAAYTFGGWSESTATSNQPAVPAHYMPTHSITLYAIWVAPVNHAVTFHSNFPTGIEYLQLQNSAVPASLNGTISYPGYRLDGWSTSPSGSSSFTPTQSYDFSVDKDLYAVWAHVAYTVTYNYGASGSWLHSAPSQADQYLDQTFNTPDATVAVRTGYHVTGWYDGGTTTVAPGASYQMPENNVTLTAQWTVDSYTTTLNLGSTATWNISPAGSANYGASFVLPAGSTIHNPGYTFGGWKLNGSGNAIAGGTSVTVPVGGINYTAVWTADTYTVTFNHGVGTGIAPNAVTFTVGQSPAYVDLAAVDVSALSYTDSTGAVYTFGGWSLAQLPSTQATVATHFLPGQSLILYAVWTPPSSNTVTFHSNYPDSSAEATLTQSTNHSAALNGSFTFTGYTLTGWSTVANTTRDYTVGQTFDFAAGGADLYAVWTGNTNTINWNANGGSGSIAPSNYVWGSMPEVTLPDGSALTPPVLGSTFLGWSLTAGGSILPGSTYAPPSNLTLYAIWQAAPAHTVTFNSDYPIAAGLASATSTQSSNVAAPLGSTIAAAPGYTQTGWTTGGQTPVVYSLGQSYSFAADLTLFAVWSISNHSVVFHSNAGVSDATVSQTWNVPKALNSNPFSRTAYSFRYWTTNADGSGARYSDAATYSFATSVALYAQWAQVEHAPEPPAKPKTLPPLLPVIIQTPPAQGTANVITEGEQGTAKVEANKSADQLNLSAADWNLKISGTDLAGNPAPLDEKSRVVLEGGQYAHTEGSGFLPNTEVHVYLVNNPVLVGILMTDDKGNFAGSLPVPTGLSLGVHIFQVDAYTPAGTIRTASFQAVVQATVGKVLTSKFYFAPTSTVLTPSNIAAIKKLAAKIPAGYAKLSVGVIGFVYPYDTKAANLLVSAKRAIAISNLLKKQGLVGQFVAKGMGRAQTATPSARRVEVTITYEVKSRG